MTAARARCGCLTLESNILVMDKLFPADERAWKSFVAIRYGDALYFCAKSVYRELVAAGKVTPGSSYQ
jgi:hypothetical protein